jgi:DNA-binding NarL/FixJ family response regulator
MPDMDTFGTGENLRARVLLADDHPAVLEDLRALLQPEFEVVGAVGDGNALLSSVEALTPDVIVTDITMPGLDGIAAAAEVLRRSPRARIVFVTVHDDTEMAQRGLAIGALGYVAKVSAGDDLVPAIHAALHGKHYVSATVRRTAN